MVGNDQFWPNGSGISGEPLGVDPGRTPGDKKGSILRNANTWVRSKSDWRRIHRKLQAERLGVVVEAAAGNAPVALPNHNEPTIRKGCNPG